jgi:hypothetical protein
VSSSQFRHDTQDELLAKFDPGPAGKDAAERQHSVAAALASMQAEGLEPGAEDLAAGSAGFSFPAGREDLLTGLAAHDA